MASEELMNSLTHHAPSNEAVVRITKLRQAAIAFGTAIEDSTPNGRCLSLAKTKLEEALMWAVKGIAVAPESELKAPPPFGK